MGEEERGSASNAAKPKTKQLEQHMSKTASALEGGSPRGLVTNRKTKQMLNRLEGVPGRGEVF